MLSDDVFHGSVEDELATECGRNKPNILKLQRYVVCSIMYVHVHPKSPCYFRMRELAQVTAEVVKCILCFADQLSREWAAGNVTI